LAEAFLQEAGRRLGRSFRKLPNDLIESLQEYSWPGNVRELENVIGRAAVTSTGLTLQLPDGWNQAPVAKIIVSSARANAVESSTMTHQMGSEAPLTLEQYERCHILEVLHETNWRIEGPKGAALILGLHPNTLRSRMQKLGVRRPSADATLTSQSL
jgi:transcriptional regulator with GAF, ATPase, and Fis domain